MRSYLGVTAHFIIDFTLMAVMMACRHFRGHHTGEEILVHFADIERAFEVTGKVDSIITDSASNMLKALRLLEISNNIESTDSDDEDELEAVEIDNALQDELDMIQPSHYSCFAHTLQLVVKDSADQMK